MAAQLILRVAKRTANLPFNGPEERCPRRAGRVCRKGVRTGTDQTVSAPWEVDRSGSPSSSPPPGAELAMSNRGRAARLAMDSRGDELWEQRDRRARDAPEEPGAQERQNHR